jgi:hypothetical protein
MRKNLGMLLRLLGPLLQVLCLFGLLSPEFRGRQVGRFSVELLLYCGFAFGILLVITGLILMRSTSSGVRGRSR